MKKWIPWFLFLFVIPFLTFAGTKIYQGGNVTEIVNPSSSGTHTLKTGGAHVAFDTSGLGYSILPKLTTAQRNAISPITAGALIYNTTTARYEFYAGAAWAAVGGAELDTLDLVVERGRISDSHNSFANRVQFTDGTNGGSGFYTHATKGPQIVSWPASGVENDLNKVVDLNAAKTWELQSQGIGKVRFTESTGALEIQGTGIIKANRTPCTGTDYLKTDGTCAAPGSSDIATTLEMRDDFGAASGSSGAVGELGWGISAGTIAGVAPETGRPGIVRMTSGAVSGNETNLVLSAGGDALVLLGSDTFDATFFVRVNTTAAADMRFGVTNNSLGVPTNGAYLEKLGADTNWFCVTRNASVETRTDTTVAVGTAFVKLRVRRTSGTNIACNVGAGVNINNTTNLPTAALSPLFYIKTNEAVAKSFDADAFYMKITGLSR